MKQDLTLYEPRPEDDRETLEHDSDEDVTCGWCDGSGVRGHGGLLASEDECTKCEGTGERPND